MDFSNAKVAHMLRDVATAYTLKKANNFQIRAYENAADTIERLTSELKDLWQDQQLDNVPGIGESLKAYLDELFRTGEVKHWIDIKKDIPESVFSFLDIPGVGPQTALKLSSAGVVDLVDLENKLENRELQKADFSQKLLDKLKIGLKQSQSLKTGRMLLPYAFIQAQKILDYLKQDNSVLKADVLGSLRRMVATVGDLDFAISTNNPEKVMKHILNMPGIKEVIEKGETKAAIFISEGIHVDFLIAKPEVYGALLQHFTGSKSHNIHLRSYAESKGFSLSEYGLLKVKNKELINCETEEEVYSNLGMQTPIPEIRENTGEIEMAIKHSLPTFIKPEDIKGDLHLHSNFNIEPSHDLGVSTMHQLIEKGQSLGYEYIGASEHQPSKANHSPEQVIELINNKKKVVEQLNYSQKSVRVLNLLELDIMTDGLVSVPEEGLKLLDFALAGVHSSHHQPKEEMTKRLIKALENPYIKVITHPTGRLLNEREASDADWDLVFKTAATHKKALEISAYPNRLDLSDYLVRRAKEYGVKFVISTDSHEVSQMDLMFFGISVGRRGWLTKEDVVNAWDWPKFAKWFNLD
ncbi:MAG: helix-hairpin-helix domain-containing protein [Candidatus Daviesbacteria bacterium]|nr:helix-hairpin-helix domain-containing protein [Candidatus Daviesbacteria bacterium]